jgi:hypothetical protein
MSRIVNIVMAIIGTGLMMTFVIGLSYSISTGFAGVSGGLPFAIIVTFVVILALYDFWEEALKKD